MAKKEGGVDAVMCIETRILPLPFFFFFFVFISLGLYPYSIHAKEGLTGKGSYQKEFKERLKKLMEPSGYFYDAGGKPDPFRPFLQTATRRAEPVPTKKQGAKKKQCGAALECMDVGQLTLVGIVMTGQKASIAVAQDSAGFGYMLRVGDRIGLHGGRVTKILPDRVIVTEKVEDIQGSLVPRKRVLLLHPEE